nr:immunoglobulin heavy chain junction region [Macaca mulatta]
CARGWNSVEVEVDTHYGLDSW